MIDINPIHLNKVMEILDEHVPECEVRAFGSRVTGTAKTYSDLDLAIVGEHRLPLDLLYCLKEVFEESDLPFRVDLLDWQTISPEFRKVIEKRYEVIHEGNWEATPEGKRIPVAFIKIDLAGATTERERIGEEAASLQMERYRNSVGKLPTRLGSPIRCIGTEMG
jgi:predicted nucleotidyltransferase